MTLPDGTLPEVEVILYVADQARSGAFYAAALAQEPVLDVPGMTAFDLGATRLGLMPAAGAARLLGPGSGVSDAASQPPRAELYLRRRDAAAVLDRALAAGGRLVSDMAARDWGEVTGYVLDPDGHVLAVSHHVWAGVDPMGQVKPGGTAPEKTNLR